VNIRPESNLSDVSPDPVVSVEWLSAAFQGPEPPRVLDVRWRLGGPPGHEEFVAGHVPGAVYVDLETELAAPPRDDRVGGRHPLPSPADVTALARRAGIRADQTVLVMDGSDGTPAARAWWLLRHAGHPDVRLLDGGWPAWVAAGGEVETGRGTSPAAGDLEVRWGTMPMVDAEGIAFATQVGVLLDARAAARYRGDVEPVDPVAGHIPGAINAPFAADLDAEGRWLPLADLRETYAALGVSGERPVVAYCGSGVTAAHTVVALARLGIDAALYPGSWSDWVSDPSRPVARG
jgi:thiosulfate/3-mercaptopyruvate sulfurtransferase